MANLPFNIQFLLNKGMDAQMNAAHGFTNERPVQRAANDLRARAPAAQPGRLLPLTQAQPGVPACRALLLPAQLHQSGSTAHTAPVQSRQFGTTKHLFAFAFSWQLLYLSNFSSLLTNIQPKFKYHNENLTIPE
jgi:hypothetical protein